MFRYLHGSRLPIPIPPVAWALLILGAALIVAGTLSAMRVRRHMNEGGGWLGSLLSAERGTLGYLIHEYDEPDRPLLLAGLFGRVVGGLAVIWGAIGVFVS